MLSPQLDLGIHKRSTNVVNSMDLMTDARVNDCRISPSNRLSRHIPTDFDDLKLASFAETFFQD